jgi:hypothetical protein
MSVSTREKGSKNMKNEIIPIIFERVMARLEGVRGLSEREFAELAAKYHREESLRYIAEALGL